MSYRETSSQRSDNNRSRDEHSQSRFNPRSTSQHIAEQRTAQSGQTNGFTQQPFNPPQPTQWDPPPQNQQGNAPPQYPEYILVNRPYQSRAADAHRALQINPHIVNPFTQRPPPPAQQTPYYTPATPTPPYSHPPPNQGYHTSPNQGQPAHPPPNQNNAQFAPLSVQNLQQHGQVNPAAPAFREAVYANDPVKPFDAVDSIRGDGRVYDHEVEMNEEEEPAFENDFDEEFTYVSEEHHSQPRYGRGYGYGYGYQ